MEPAIILLAKHFERVLVRYQHKLYPPIRLRVKKLAEVKPYLRRNSPSTEGQVAQWRENGGVLLSYHLRGGFESPHDVRFFTECPFSLAEFGDDGIPVVAYWPTTWQRHWNNLEFMFPQKDTCRRMHAEIKAAGMDARHAEIFEALGFETKDIVSITDKQLAARLGMITYHMFKTRRVVFRGILRAMIFVWPMRVRIEPQDQSLLPMYRAICALRQLNGEHLALGGELSKVARFWKTQVRALNRCGSIQAMDRITFYDLRDVKPDMRRIGKKHTEAKNNLAKLIYTLGRAPELTEEALKWKS